MGRPWRATGAIVPLLMVGCGMPGPDPAPPMTPQVFALGAISDHREQYRITFTPSGDTAYFGVSDAFFPASRRASIQQGVRVDGEWQTPEVAPFSGTYSDIDPFVSPDGRRLYFSSIRPVAGADRSDLNTWVVERVGSGWSEPRVLATVNSPHDDLYPSVDRAGNLYFGSDRPRPGSPAGWNIWMARATADGYAEPEPLSGAINSEQAWEFNPAISPDGERLVFTRLDVTNPVATGLGQIMVSRLAGGRWGEAVEVGPPVNSPLDEYHPSFSPDGNVLFFVRRDPSAPGATGSIYHVHVSAVGDRLR